MGSSNQPEPDAELEDRPGVTFNVNPYEIGCDVAPEKRVAVDVIARPDTHDEEIVVRDDDQEWTLLRAPTGVLEPATADTEVPRWLSDVVEHVGIGSVRD